MWGWSHGRVRAQIWDAYFAASVSVFFSFSSSFFLSLFCLRFSLLFDSLASVFSKDHCFLYRIILNAFFPASGGSMPKRIAKTAPPPTLFLVVGTGFSIIAPSLLPDLLGCPVVPMCVPEASPCLFQLRASILPCGFLARMSGVGVSK